MCPLQNLVIAGESATDSIRVVKGGETAAMKKAKAEANKEQVAKQIKSLGETILAGGKELSWTAVKDEI